MPHEPHPGPPSPERVAGVLFGWGPDGKVDRDVVEIVREGTGWPDPRPRYGVTGEPPAETELERGPE